MLKTLHLAAAISVLTLGVFVPSITFAELPKGNTFIFVGKGSNGETSYYVDRVSASQTLLTARFRLLTRVG